MKGLKIFLPALALIGALGLGSASAQHGHHGHGHSHARIGFAFGGPGYWPYYGAPYPYYYPYHPYYSYPYYGYPPTMPVQTSPPVYVERGQDEAEGEYYWYYCSNPKGYYPYIGVCNTNWQRVTPVPQGN